MSIRLAVSIDDELNRLVTEAAKRAHGTVSHWLRTAIIEKLRADEIAEAKRQALLRPSGRAAKPALLQPDAGSPPVELPDEPFDLERAADESFARFEARQAKPK